MLLILMHAGLQQGGIVRFPGLFLLRRAMLHQRHTHLPRPSGNATMRQRSPKAAEAWWGSIPTICRPQKRARDRTSGILKAKRSTARTCHNRVARTRKTRDENASEAGRGAERLATLNAHGSHSQPLPGPSFQQGWMMEPAHGSRLRLRGVLMRK